MAARDASTDAALAELRAFGLGYPGAHSKSPWPGHADLAVNDKTFAYLSVAGDPFSISCKLPHTCDDALALPFSSPTAYGLGKSGWVTAQLSEGPVPVDLFKAWIDESYRAQAPKRLVTQLPADGALFAAPTAPAKKRPAKKKAGSRSALAARKNAAKKRASRPPSRAGARRRASA